LQDVTGEKQKFELPDDLFDALPPPEVVPIKKPSPERKSSY
jgi:hypothetical protein